MSRLTRQRASEKFGLTADSILGSATWDAAVTQCRAQLSAVRPRSRFSALSGHHGREVLVRRLGLAPKNRGAELWRILRRFLWRNVDRPGSASVPR